jgi:hypothetical protein
VVLQASQTLKNHPVRASSVALLFLLARPPLLKRFARRGKKLQGEEHNMRDILTTLETE